jgi:DNA polymerase III delta prime subunit
MNTNLLYKYRPVFFKDFIIDAKVITLLDSFINLDYINLLLIGPDCCGKSTLLKSIVYEYYGTQNIPNNNIMIINNLSEQGISFYRNEVKTFCQTPSLIAGKKKFIIVDDIEQISEQSQQVFRNCIDKYRHNVNFITSGKNIQKIVESLQSRLNIINLPPIQIKNMKKLLKKIINQENMLIDNDVIDFVIRVSNNSLRLQINYIEKFKLLGIPINIDLAKKLCCNISYSIFEDYTKAVISGKLQIALCIVNDLYNNGFSVMDILDNYFEYIKITDKLNEEKKYVFIKLISKSIIRFHAQNEHCVELVLLTHEFIKQLNHNII